MNSPFPDRPTRLHLTPDLIPANTIVYIRGAGTVESHPANMITMGNTPEELQNWSAFIGGPMDNRKN